MFVGDELRAEVSFTAVAARLANLTAGGSLIQASHAAWGEGIARVGPIGPVPGMSKLVRIRFREPVQHGGMLVLTLRWEATGASGALFPVLDADITLAPDGDQTTLIGLRGVYRPPAGAVGAGLDRAIMHRVATATIRSLLSQITDAITHPAPAREGLAGAGGPGVISASSICLPAQ
jgi:hypothetical protein